MRPLLLAAALAGCAEGSTVPIEPEPAQDAAPDARTYLGIVDHLCTPVSHGRVCAFLCQRDPEDCAGRVIEEIPITCADRRIVGSERCEAFSFDPLRFSPDSWAYCCIAEDDAGGLR